MYNYIVRTSTFPIEASLTPPNLCACPKDFQLICRSRFFVFSELREEVIFRFVDNSGIVDHHCFNFLFTIHNIKNKYQEAKYTF